MSAGYIGWRLSAEERARLLALFPPRYARPVADHVTLRFGAPPDAPLPTETAGDVIGVADDGSGVQALVVAIGGSSERPDGSTLHITWSLADGRRPVESNTVLREFGWRPVESVAIRLEPARFR